MTGRLWARDLLVKQLREGLHPFGYQGEDYLGQTDLQVAALGWLAQHILFARMVEQFGPGRVATLDSESADGRSGAQHGGAFGLFRCAAGCRGQCSRAGIHDAQQVR